METHILDLSKRLWHIHRYGLDVVGTWVRIDNRWRPCIAIARPGYNPCVIPLEDAWLWSDTIGDPHQRAGRFLIRLGIDADNPDNRHKLISLVNSRMEDLIAMPPRPPEAQEHDEPVAELTLYNDVTGKTEVEL